MTKNVATQDEVSSINDKVDVMAMELGKTPDEDTETEEKSPNEAPGTIVLLLQVRRDQTTLVTMLWYYKTFKY